MLLSQLLFACCRLKLLLLMSQADAMDCFHFLVASPTDCLYRGGDVATRESRYLSWAPKLGFRCSAPVLSCWMSETKTNETEVR